MTDVFANPTDEDGILSGCIRDRCRVLALLDAVNQLYTGCVPQ
jgi:hypothetical protein